MSAMCAPTGPIQLRAGAPPGEGAETLNDASCGEYESRLSASRMARLRPTKPTISLSLLLSEGVRIRTTISPFYPERQAQHSGAARRCSIRAFRLRQRVSTGVNRRPDSAARRPEVSKLQQVQIGEGRRVRNLVRAGANAQDPGGGTRATQEL